MATHAAVVTVGLKKPLEIKQVPTVQPNGDQVRVRVEWTASTPLDLHQSDGGLLVNHPSILGDGTAGTVIEVGPDVKRLKIGDQVFGFTWRSQQEKAHQEFCTTNEWLFAVLPEGLTLAQAVTVPNNLVTVFHSLTADLDIELPWPKPEDHVPADATQPILVWGGASSVGQYAIQILRFYGYTSVLTTASPKRHAQLRELGAKWTLDYNDPKMTSTILATVQSYTGSKTSIPLILDCIGSKRGSLEPISKVAKRGAKVAIMLPVVVKDSSETEAPAYEMDVSKAADWEDGVDAKGVRTHFYLEERIVQPNAQKIVEGNTMLERAQAAMDALRRKETSMERLVWRVSDR